ncbi:MAG: DUF86 domain-containing protein [Candidatus Hydrogenedentes bacterium]|nr:DUF86 domain-containing protein [Candidatus Hydrogenedentota bacterium]
MTRLWDMLTYAKEIQSRVSTMTFEMYLADSDRRLATERRLEIIGEAAKNHSQRFIDQHPTIPWRAIIGMRNVLAHEYGEIRHERVFHTAQQSIPELIRGVEALLAPPPSNDV